MKTFTFFLLQGCLLFFAFGVPAQIAKPDATQPNMKQTEKVAKLPEVRAELLKRLKASRELRMELVKNNNSAGVSHLVKSDQENTEWVKSAIEKYGWLGNSLVGVDGQEAAFKLVMYAIQDPGFQKQYFELLQKAVKDGEAPAAQSQLLAERMKLMGGNAMTLPPSASIKTTNGASTQIGNSQTASVKYPELRAELLKRMTADQQVRIEQNQKYKGAPLPAAAQAEMLKIDQENTAWIKPLMKQHGWLGNSLVGVDGATAAFLLVQHTQDAEFRKSSLELLTKAVKDGEARGDQLALLTDRILMIEGKPQRYGTQPILVKKDGKIEMQPIEDEANVDKRRAEVGLGPLAEYIERLKQMNSKPKN